MERNGETERNPNIKFVGMKIDENLNWKAHNDMIRNKCAKGTYMISTLKNQIPQKTKLLLYNALVKSHLQYGIAAWGSHITKPLTIIQKKAIRYVTNSKRNEHTAPLFHKLKTLKIQDMYIMEICKLAHKCVHKTGPTSLYSLINIQNITAATRSSYDGTILEVPRIRLTKTANTHIVKLPTYWNNLEQDLRNAITHKILGNRVKNSKLSEYAKEKCNTKDCYTCKDKKNSPSQKTTN
jgi:hypothetical protein